MRKGGKEAIQKEEIKRRVWYERLVKKEEKGREMLKMGRKRNEGT